jgi:hypothetical protein
MNMFAFLRSQRIRFLLFGFAIVAALMWTASATRYHSSSAVGSTVERPLWFDLVNIGAVRDPVALEDVLPGDKAALNVNELSKNLTAEKWAAVESAAEESVAASPLNSRMWLVLAISLAAQHSSPESLVSALKMSYYTAPNDLTITEPRLELSLQVESSWDFELKDAVLRDIRNISLGSQVQRVILARAYCRASPEGRAVIDDVARDFERAREEAHYRAC